MCEGRVDREAIIHQGKLTQCKEGGKGAGLEMISNSSLFRLKHVPRLPSDPGTAHQLSLRLVACP